MAKHRMRADPVKVRAGQPRNGHPRLIMTNDSAAIAKSTQMNKEYKLHLVMDRDSYARLGWLKANLEASTDGEVIRRALKVYEIMEPQDALENVSKGPNLGHFYPEKDVEHVYIRLPARMKERLDYERENFDRSYGEQVRQALRVLVQLVREREKLVAQVSKEGGEDYAQSKPRSVKLDTERKLAVLC